jgi:hypothetical protein
MAELSLLICVQFDSIGQYIAAQSTPARMLPKLSWQVAPASLLGRFETMHARLPLQTDNCTLRGLQKTKRTHSGQR